MTKTYSYSIANDTLHGVVDPGTLHSEVGSDPAITIGVSSIDILGDVLDVIMKAAMPDEINNASAILATRIAAHTGVALLLEPIQTVAPTFEDTGGIHPLWQGRLYDVVAGQLNIFDEVVTTEKQLRGGWFRLLDVNASVGDYIEEAVVDKDDVLGLFSTYGMTVGTHVLELKKYVRTEYVNPADFGRQEFMANSTFVVMAGLYVRTIYMSTGVVDLKLGVTTLAYE